MTSLKKNSRNLKQERLPPAKSEISSGRLILQDRSLRPTKIRQELFQYLKQKGHAVSYTAMENDMKAVADKVTIYRTLKLFDEAGIVHKVVDEHGIAQYALCEFDECDHGHHGDSHLHFECEKCGKIYCLTQAETPEVNLPKGYKLTYLRLKGEGICALCYTN